MGNRHHQDRAKSHPNQHARWCKSYIGAVLVRQAQIQPRGMFQAFAKELALGVATPWGSPQREPKSCKRCVEVRSAWPSVEVEGHSQFRSGRQGLGVRRNRATGAERRREADVGVFQPVGEAGSGHSASDPPPRAGARGANVFARARAISPNFRQHLFSAWGEGGNAAGARRRPEPVDLRRVGSYLLWNV